MRKFLPYILILVILVGLFSPVVNIRASLTDPNELCENNASNMPCKPIASQTLGICKFLTPSGQSWTDPETGETYTANTYVVLRITKTACDSQNPKGNWTLGTLADFTASRQRLAAQQPTQANTDAAAAASRGNAFEDYLANKECFALSFGIPPEGALNVDVCGIKIAYYLLYIPAGWALWLAGQFFNVLLGVTINSPLFKGAFIGSAWAVVRDLSNIFFILILLYVAIQLILGIGGHDVKKMIRNVVIVALLINFSMFFTSVVIDSSNILALIFYNKLNVNTENVDKSTREYTSISGEVDVAGGLVKNFNPTSFLSEDFFKQAKNPPIVNGVQPTSTGEPGFGIILGITLTAVAVMLFAAYAFFIAGFSFLGRMIELFILIIFSPFAFMSSTVPKLSGTEYIGWDAWFKRLISVAFMAPIFMFFMYFIFLLVSVKPSIFDGMVGNKDTLIGTVLSVVIPALIILALLMKATEFAKKGSGKFGEMAMAGAKLAGGLALGAATGGTAMLASNTVGRAARNVANDEELKERAARGDKGAQRKLALANSLAKSSFDVRQTGIGKFAAKQTGMDMSKGLGALGLNADQLKGGRKERDKEAIEKGIEVRKTYEMSTAASHKQDALAADKNNPQNVRAANYETDRREAMSLDPDLDEAKFKKTYEEGGDLEQFGIERKVSAGSVEKIKNSKDVNKERKEAYALSLENPNKKIEDGEAVKKGLKGWSKDIASSFVSGVESMTMTPKGIAVTAAAGIATGGVGAIVAPFIGGLAFAIKDVLRAEAQRIPLLKEHKDIVAGIRKGPDEYKELIKKMKKDLEGGGHDKEPKHEEAHPPAPQPAAEAHPSTGNSHPTHS